VIEVKIERLREGAEPRLAANLIVSQFVLAPDGGADAGDEDALGEGRGEAGE
jgi:hypothetical protein